MIVITLQFGKCSPLVYVVKDWKKMIEMMMLLTQLDGADIRVHNKAWEF